MKINQSNYYSLEANKHYLSASSYKEAIKCEACYKAQLMGTYEKPETRALLLGSLVDELLTGNKKSIEVFYANNHDNLYTKKGEPYADVQKALNAVDRVKSQPLMMEYLSGRHQVIMTGKIDGVDWRIKMDSYKGGKFIADLKYLKDLGTGNPFKNPVKEWGYDTSMAIYQEIVFQRTGKRLPIYLVIVTKEEVPRCEVCEIKQWNLDEALEDVRKNQPRVVAVRDGLVIPENCKVCDYCAATMKISAPIDSDLLGMSTKQIKTLY